MTVGLPSTSYYVDGKSRTHKSSYFLMTFLPPDQRETGCYAWHGTKAVTLTGAAPLSKALGPGLSVSKIAPLGGVRSWFCWSARRSLGPGLLWGQRSRRKRFADLRGSLVHPHHSTSDAACTGHRHHGDSRGQRARRGFADRAETLSELAVLPERRPGGVAEVTSQPRVAGVGNRAPLGAVAGGRRGGHHPQKSCQVA